MNRSLKLKAERLSLGAEKMTDGQLNILEGEIGFNSLIEDMHVDADAPHSMELFDYVKKLVNSSKFDDIRIRGLKIDYKSQDQKEEFCKIEVLCRNEQGIVDFIKTVKQLKGKITFTYIRLMGDNHEERSASHQIKISEVGFNAIIQGFTEGYFYMTNEFRIYNFDPELTPLLAYAQSLKDNQTF